MYHCLDGGWHIGMSSFLIRYYPNIPLVKTGWVDVSKVDFIMVYMLINAPFVIRETQRI